MNMIEAPVMTPLKNQAAEMKRPAGGISAGRFGINTNKRLTSLIMPQTRRALPYLIR
jgi:hypothetical protein